MKNKIITIISMIILSLSLIFVINNMTNKTFTNKAISKDGFYFDTYIKITIYDCKENASSTNDFNNILEECMNMCAYYEKICSPTNKDSELYKLNHYDNYTTTPALTDIINKTIETTTPFSEKFSIYSGDLCALWDFNKKTIPNETDIKKALNNLNENNSTSITLGASAKGYIADKIAEYLKEQGINEALIDLGGNIVAIGDKYNDKLYGIGIKKPFDSNGDTITAVKVKNKSVVTSGIYERYFEDDGQIYHHIIDIETGYPADNDILSVTIIADSSLVADCYSTGCFLMGIDYTLDLINNKHYEDVECIIIDKNYNMHLSDGLIKKDGFIILNNTK